MMEFLGKTIVITGGASGIGRALAIECMCRGASVALADIDEKGAQQTKAIAEGSRQAGTKCTAHVLDVTDLDAWKAFRKEILAKHGEVDGIINNAGISFHGPVEDTSYEQLERVMSINFMGVVYGSKEFLPLLKKRPTAVIANVASVLGLFAVKHQSSYCASKFAARGFTESLSQELKGTNILVSCILPGHIGTNIAHKANESGDFAGEVLTDEEKQEFADEFKKLGLRPSDAARIILDGLEKRKRTIKVGKDAVLGDLLNRYFPRFLASYANKAAI